MILEKSVEREKDVKQVDVHGLSHGMYRVELCRLLGSLKRETLSIEFAGYAELFEMHQL